MIHMYWCIKTSHSANFPDHYSWLLCCCCCSFVSSRLLINKILLYIFYSLFTQKSHTATIRVQTTTCSACKWQGKGAILFILRPDLKPFPEHVFSTSKRENDEYFRRNNTRDVRNTCSFQGITNHWYLVPINGLKAW